MNYNNWYAVQVASGCEKKARADLLARKDVLGDRFIKNVEVPESQEMKFNKAGNRRIVKTKLLPGYILVQVMKEVIETESGETKKVFPASSHDAIQATFNVLGFAGSDKKKPRVMKPEQVEGIFKRVDEAHIEIKQNVVLDYQEGDILDVISGPFAGYSCEVSSIQGNKILGQLDMFGRIVPAEFTKEQVYKK